MTKIEWADDSWNPIVGCSLVSPGCKNCYAMRVAHRLGKNPRLEGRYAGLTEESKARPVWNGQVRLVEEVLAKPLSWKRPRRIFVNSMGDLFHGAIPPEAHDKVLRVVMAAHWHRFLVLTKRPARQRHFMASSELQTLATELTDDPTIEWPPANLWLGVSAENQRWAEERVPKLVLTRAARRFVSAEPLLGPLDLSEWLHPGGLDWVIVGGESGPGARPCHPDWVRALRDQCVGAGVPFFFKQWGAYAPGYCSTDRGIEVILRDGRHFVDNDPRPEWRELTPAEWEGREIVRRVGKKAAGRRLDGRVWDQWPTI